MALIFIVLHHVHVKACPNKAVRYMSVDSGHGLEAGLWLSARVMGLLWEAWSARLDL